MIKPINKQIAKHPKTIPPTPIFFLTLNIGICSLEIYKLKIHNS
jgi:hypothetical protein